MRKISTVGNPKAESDQPAKLIKSDFNFEVIFKIHFRSEKISKIIMGP